MSDSRQQQHGHEPHHAHRHPGRPCGHSQVSDLQEGYVSSFKAYLRSLHDNAHRRLMEEAPHQNPTAAPPAPSPDKGAQGNGTADTAAAAHGTGDDDSGGGDSEGSSDHEGSDSGEDSSSAHSVSNHAGDGIGSDDGSGSGSGSGEPTEVMGSGGSGGSGSGSSEGSLPGEGSNTGDNGAIEGDTSSGTTTAPITAKLVPGVVVGGAVRHAAAAAVPPLSPPKGPSTLRIATHLQLGAWGLRPELQAAAAHAVHTAVRVVQKFVQVSRPLQAPLVVRPGLADCEPATIDPSFVAGKGGGVAGADLLLLITAHVEHAGCKGGVLAWATACDFDLATSRPILGVVNLCPALFSADNSSAVLTPPPPPPSPPAPTQPPANNGTSPSTPSPPPPPVNATTPRLPPANGTNSGNATAPPPGNGTAPAHVPPPTNVVAVPSNSTGHATRSSSSPPPTATSGTGSGDSGDGGGSVGGNVAASGGEGRARRFVLGTTHGHRGRVREGSQGGPSKLKAGGGRGGGAAPGRGLSWRAVLQHGLWYDPSGDHSNGSNRRQQQQQQHQQRSEGGASPPRATAALDSAEHAERERALLVAARSRIRHVLEEVGGAHSSEPGSSPTATPGTGQGAAPAAGAGEPAKAAASAPVGSPPGDPQPTPPSPQPLPLPAPPQGPTPTPPSPSPPSPPPPLPAPSPPPAPAANPHPDLGGSAVVGAVGAGKGGTVGDGGEEEGEGMGAEVGSMFELDPQAVDALVHEMVHVLGFHASLFDDFRDPRTANGARYTTPALQNRTIYNSARPWVPAQMVSFLSTPRAVSEARRALGCSALPGVPLENEGGRSAALHHWEFRHFHQDLMAPYFFHGVRARVTGVTLALLEDSGWYTPRWGYVQPVEGRPATGCDVSLSPCEDHNTRLPGAYYCSSPTPAYAAYAYGSSPAVPAARPCLSPLVQAACGEVTPFSDGCGVLRAGVACTDEAGVGGAYPPEMDGNGDEAGVFLGFGGYFGADSRCMMYGAKEVPRRPGCFKVSFPGADTNTDDDDDDHDEDEDDDGEDDDDEGDDEDSDDDVITASDAGEVNVHPFVDAGFRARCPAAMRMSLQAVTGVSGLVLECPADVTVQASMAASMGVGCQGCVHGNCLPSGQCACWIEWMGRKCNKHVDDVWDFDDPDAPPPPPSPPPPAPRSPVGAGNNTTTPPPPSASPSANTTRPPPPRSAGITPSSNSTVAVKGGSSLPNSNSTDTDTDASGQPLPADFDTTRLSAPPTRSSTLAAASAQADTYEDATPNTMQTVATGSAHAELSSGGAELSPSHDEFEPELCAKQPGPGYGGCAGAAAHGGVAAPAYPGVGGSSVARGMAVPAYPSAPIGGDSGASSSSSGGGGDVASLEQPAGGLGVAGSTAGAVASGSPTPTSTLPPTPPPTPGNTASFAPPSPFSSAAGVETGSDAEYQPEVAALQLPALMDLRYILPHLSDTQARPETDPRPLEWEGEEESVAAIGGGAVGVGMGVGVGVGFHGEGEGGAPLLIDPASLQLLAVEELEQGLHDGLVGAQAGHALAGPVAGDGDGMLAGGQGGEDGQDGGWEVV